MDEGLERHLTDAGAMTDGELDRTWFEESVSRSRRAVVEGYKALAGLYRRIAAAENN